MRPVTLLALSLSLATAAMNPTDRREHGWQGACSDPQQDEDVDRIPRLLEAASTAGGQGDFEEARRCILQAVEALGEVEATDGIPLARGIARHANRLGLVQAELGAWRWIVAAHETLPDVDELEVLHARAGHAMAVYMTGQHVEAHKLIRGVHDTLSDLVPPDHSHLLSVKVSLAETAKALGEFEEARKLEEHVHTALEGLLPPGHPGLLRIKSALAETLCGLGEYERALDLMQYVHMRQQGSLDVDDMDLLGTKVHLAEIQLSLGDVEGAHKLYFEVHERCERILPFDHPNLLGAKCNLALTYKARGDLLRALELEEHALEVWSEVLPEHAHHLLDVQSNLAMTREQLGDLEGSLTLEERVLAGWERWYPPDHHVVLTAKEHLALTYLSLGDHERALSMLEAVHAQRERQAPPTDRNLLRCKIHLASARSEAGDLEGARSLEEHVLTAQATVLPPDHPELVANKVNLGMTRYQMGELDGALDLLEQAHEVWERTNHVDLPAVKWNLAGLRFAMGERRLGLDLFEQVQATWDGQLPSDHPKLLHVKSDVAAMRRVVGDLDGAVEMAGSLLAGQASRSDALRLLAPRVARASARTEFKRINKALFSCAGTDSEGSTTLDRALFEAIENLRAVSTASVRTLRAASRSEAVRALRDRVIDCRRMINDRSLSPPRESAELSAWRESLDRLTGERDRLEGELRLALSELGVKWVRIRAAEVAKALDDGSVAISFLRYLRPIDPSPSAVKAPPPVESLVAFVVSSGGSLRRVDLGRCDELVRMATGWRASIGKPVTDAEEWTDETDPGEVLRERLLDPCLDGSWPDRIHIVLDDFLHLIPLDALPAGDGELVGEKSEIVVEVSFERLLDSDPLHTVGGTLVAVGGVDYWAEGIQAPSLTIATMTPPLSDSRAGEDGQVGVWLPLPETRKEVEGIQAQFRALIGDEPVLLVDRGATKRALVQVSRRARYLHVATHGWFAPDYLRSLWDDDSISDSTGLGRMTTAEETVRGFAPETLCGLALAGANHGSDALGRMPGLTTAEELATLDLSLCELAVLSACETNVGSRRAGQGIQSLQAALHAAGAKTSITSLWRVDDEAARLLMARFYSNLWDSKLPKAEALWQAKVHLMDLGHPPERWAGWVLAGDPD